MHDTNIAKEGVGGRRVTVWGACLKEFFFGFRSRWPASSLIICVQIVSVAAGESGKDFTDTSRHPEKQKTLGNQGFVSQLPRISTMG